MCLLFCFKTLDLRYISYLLQLCLKFDIVFDGDALIDTPVLMPSNNEGDQCIYRFQKFF